MLLPKTYRNVPYYNMVHNPTIVFLLSLLIALPAWADSGSVETTEYIVYYVLISHPKKDDPFRNLHIDPSAKDQAVDFQKSLFHHTNHKIRLLEYFRGDTEESCRVCHHNKKSGESPGRCTSCHTTSSVSRSLLREKGRKEMFKGSRGALGFLNTTKGKKLELRDAYHALCNGCHMAERGRNNELWGQQKRAPILCIGCHMLR